MKYMQTELVPKDWKGREQGKQTENYDENWGQKSHSCSVWMGRTHGLYERGGFQQFNWKITPRNIGEFIMDPIFTIWVYPNIGLSPKTPLTSTPRL